VIACDLDSVRVWFTDRHGGVSGGPYRSANLATHVGDDEAAVDENRRLVARRLGLVGPASWAWLRQVHGRRVVTDPVPGDAPEADAVVSREAGRPVVVLTADCAPLALANTGAVAVAHAGWPGLERGLVQAAVRAIRAAGEGPVRAVLGPCVHPSSYAFGPDLLARLVTRFGADVAATTADGRPALDIPAAVRSALDAVGIDRFEDVGVCTAASPDHFSHRRDGVTGRQGAIAMLA
jgi:YfiH family protein